MSGISRRSLVTAGIGTVVGGAVVAIAAKVSGQNGLLPPDHSGFYGPGETLNYATHRLLARNSTAREFSREQISQPPFPSGRLPRDEAYTQHLAQGFTDWQLAVDGMVTKPGLLSLGELKSYPVTSQITHLACEEGWSYIAQWTGVRLSHVLEMAGVKPGAKYVAYFSMQKSWWDSMDLEEAMHPQTLLAYSMNGQDLPAKFGGPLRMRVPRQLGYKSVKYISRITVTDSMKNIGNGLGSAAPAAGYAWYAGV
jgi:DMSO/TMAO reductase YedYZ molybdopterin-dependent catalytic subunit